MSVLVIIDEGSFPVRNEFLRCGTSLLSQAKQTLATIIARAGYTGKFTLKFGEFVKGGPEHQGRIVFGAPRQFYIELRMQPGNNKTHVRLGLTCPHGIPSDQFKKKLEDAQTQLANEVARRLEQHASAESQRRDKLLAARAAVARSSENPLHVKLVSSRSDPTNVRSIRPEAEEPKIAEKVSVGSLLGRLKKIEEILKLAEKDNQREPEIEAEIAAIDQKFIALADQRAKLTSELSEIQARRGEAGDVNTLEKEIGTIESRIKSVQGSGR